MGETICKHISDVNFENNFVLNIKKHFYNFTAEAKHTDRKWANDMNSHFTQGNILMENKHLKRSSISLALGTLKLEAQWEIIYVHTYQNG